jgi:hypothetical protein
VSTPSAWSGKSDSDEPGVTKLAIMEPELARLW